MYSSCFPLSCLGLYIHVVVLNLTPTVLRAAELVNSLSLLKEAREPFCFSFHILERPRLAVGVGVHPKRLRRSSVSMYTRPGGSRGEVLREHTLPLFKFDVNGIGLGSAKLITLQAPREEVEMDMRHRLPRCGTVLRR